MKVLSTMVEGQGGDQGLALARGHLGDLVLMEGDAPDQLGVEMHHLPGELVVADDGFRAAEAAGGVLHHREGLGQQVVQFLAAGDPGLELAGLGLQLLLRQGLVLDLEGVDPLHEGGALPEELPIVAAGEELEDAEKHGSGANP